MSGQINRKNGKALEGQKKAARSQANPDAPVYASLRDGWVGLDVDGNNGSTWRQSLFTNLRKEHGKYGTVVEVGEYPEIGYMDDEEAAEIQEATGCDDDELKRMRMKAVSDTRAERKRSEEVYTKVFADVETTLADETIYKMQSVESYRAARDEANDPLEGFQLIWKNVVMGLDEDTEQEVQFRAGQEPEEQAKGRHCSAWVLRLVVEEPRPVRADGSELPRGLAQEAKYWVDGGGSL